MSIDEAYEILELYNDKSFDALKKAYRMAAKKYHPDQIGGNEEIYKKVEEAYNLLKNPFYQEFISKFDNRYGIRKDNYLYPEFLQRIYKLVMITENNLADINDYDEALLYLNNNFFNQYQNILEEYIRFYINNYINENKNIMTKNEGKKISDSIINNNELYNLNIKDVNNLISESLTNKVHKEKQDYYNINVEEISKYYHEKLDIRTNTFKKYQSYNELKDFINDNYNNTKRKIVDFVMNNKNNSVSYIIKNIDYYINSYGAYIERSLELKDKFNEVQRKCFKYLNNLINKKYLEKELEEYYIEKIYNARNISVLNNISEELYTKYYYPKKVYKIKDKFEKKYNVLIKKNNILGEEYLEQKDVIWNLLNKGISKEFLNIIEYLDLKDINKTYDILEQYLKKEESNKKHM